MSRIAYLVATALLVVLSFASPAFGGVDPVQPNPDTGEHFNRYHYAEGNPYRYTDPDGRQAKNMVKGAVRILHGLIKGPPKPPHAAPRADPRIDAQQRAGHNGVEGPVQRVERTTRGGDTAVRITYPDGSIQDVSPARVKEFVPNLHPSAPPGSLQRVKFDTAIPGTKGFKREPGQSDLDNAGLIP
jgi:hypothetical protein